jgi:hypothetical protein
LEKAKHIIKEREEKKKQKEIELAKKIAAKKGLPEPTTEKD